MPTMILPREINFVKMGAVAAFLLAATFIAMGASTATLSDAQPDTETQQFLDDIVDKKNQAIAVAWFGAFSGLVVVSFFLGLYYGLRRWGEDYMRVAVLFAVVAALFQALGSALYTAFAAYIVPAWADAGDAATRAAVLSDAKTLAWAAEAIRFNMLVVAIGIAFIAASLVMLRPGRRWWTVLGWLGIIGGVGWILDTFESAVEGLSIAGIIGFGLTFFWILGVGVGLWRLPAAEAAT